jgi:hypothetical protein
MIRFGIPACLIALLTAGSCSQISTGPLPPGEWGGQHIGLTVFDRGATLEYDCASGTIDQRIVSDAGGNFVATGTHTRGHGGPIRDNEVPDRHPARYNGWTDGDTMTLSVTLTDSGESIGSYRLGRGQSPLVFRCL